MDILEGLKSLGKSVLSSAPAVATVLGHPEIGIAMKGVQALAKCFGLGDDATPDQVEAAITADPQAALKLKQLNMEFELARRDQDIEELKTRLGDIQSARSAKVEGEKATGTRDKNLYALAWLGVLNYIGLIILVVFYGLPKMTTELALMVGNLIGIVGAKYSSIYDFFFGSSKSSSDKTEAFARAAGGGGK